MNLQSQSLHACVCVISLAVYRRKTRFIAQHLDVLHRVISACDAIRVDPSEQVYSVVLMRGGRTEYDHCIRLMADTTLQEEGVRILSSLGAVQSEDLLARVLEHSLSVGETYIYSNRI